MRLCTGIRRSPGSIRRDIAGYLNVHDLEGLFHCIAGGVRDLCGQTARPRLLPQMEAAVEAVEAVGLNQVKEVEKEWFAGWEREYEMFGRRLALAKDGA